jgi:hypothetical protein
MAGERLVPLSAKQLLTEVPKAVEAALKRNPKFPGGKLEPGFVCIPPWICGFILRDVVLEKGTLADTRALATDVAKTLKGGAPTALIRDGHIICGFVPEPGIPIFKP